MAAAENTDFPLEKAGLLPREEMLEITTPKKNLTIGVAKESANDENRVALAPHAVELLVNNGHKVYVEKDAGKSANFSDKKYNDVGGIITSDKAEIYQTDVIVKVAPLNDREIDLLKGNQVLISSFHIGTQIPTYVDKLQKKKITTIGFEFYMDRRKEVSPIVQSMSEISGTTSVLIAAEYLSNATGGKGEMLGGISGVSPTDIVILGADIAAEYAARTALGVGATVKIFDCSVHKLRGLQERLGSRVFTSILQPRVLTKALRSADVVIGAISPENDRQTFIVSEETIMQMKPNSVIIDLQIDHGGCFETSEVTNFQNPVYTTHGVVHYCVPNIPSRVARTASYALSNILGHLLIELGDCGGISNLARQHAGVRAGIYIYNGILTKESIGNKFNLPWQDINLIMAAF